MLWVWERDWMSTQNIRHSWLKGQYTEKKDCWSKKKKKRSQKAVNHLKRRDEMSACSAIRMWEVLLTLPTLRTPSIASLNPAVPVTSLLSFSPLLTHFDCEPLRSSPTLQICKFVRLAVICCPITPQTEMPHVGTGRSVSENLCFQPVSTSESNWKSEG